MQLGFCVIAQQKRKTRNAKRNEKNDAPLLRSSALKDVRIETRYVCGLKLSGSDKFVSI